MNFPRLCLLAVLPLAASAADAPRGQAVTPVPRPTAADRYAVVKQRIDTLLALRTDPTPFPADRPNPFALPTDAAPSAPAQPLALARADLDRPLTDAELLPRLAAGLRIGGVIELGDAKPRVIINQRNFREGDAIFITYRDQPLKLIVKSLSAEQLVLGLNDAEVSLRLKKSR